jgi:hypothetical protein
MKDAVVAMTLLAVGSMRVIQHKCLSMNTTHVIIHLAGMTTSTIHRAQIIGVGKSIISGIFMA